MCDLFLGVALAVLRTLLVVLTAIRYLPRAYLAKKEPLTIVADPDPGSGIRIRVPGSGAFLTPGSGIGKSILGYATPNLATPDSDTQILNKHPNLHLTPCTT